MSVGYISRLLRLIFALILAATLCGILLLAMPSGRLDQGLGSSPVPCPAGFDGLNIAFGNFFDGEPPTPEVGALLEDPNFGASAEAAKDLRDGIVDPRLVDTLLVLTEKHQICVDAFKQGHYFIEGVEDGPYIPDEYGSVGGLVNTHYFGRAVDIWDVDGKVVEGNGTDEDVLSVGWMLAGMSAEERPDQIIGPPGWAERLDRSRKEGWILAEDQLELHRDHIHIGYKEENSNKNRR